MSKTVKDVLITASTVYKYSFLKVLPKCSK